MLKKGLVFFSLVDIMAHSANDVSRRMVRLNIDTIAAEEKQFYNLTNITAERYKEFLNECVWMPIGKDMVYMELPVDVERDPEFNLDFFKQRNNVRILERPDEFGRQVFLPGIAVERVIQSPDLPEGLIAKLEQMNIVKKQKYVHIQSYLHLVDYWSQFSQKQRQGQLQETILKEIKKHKSKKSLDLFKKTEAKTIANNISSVRFDITDSQQSELYYIFSSMERLRTLHDKAPCTYDNLRQYFTRFAFNAVCNKFMCGFCYNDMEFADLGGFRSVRYGTDQQVVTLNKEELLNEFVQCCKNCFGKED